MTYSEEFLGRCAIALDGIDYDDIERMVDILSNLEGRLFIIGSGGGAGHASHATGDFRKLCNIEAYAPYDNVPEMTARANDEGWDTTAEGWLRVSRLNDRDCLFIFSVGGGNENVSPNLVNAIDFAVERGAYIVGVVGKNGGYTKKCGDAVLVLPEVEPITPIVEGFQSIIWHLLVSHPKLTKNKTVW